MKLSLASIGERASQVFGSLFDDLDFESMLQPLSDLVELFDSSTTEGAALRGIIQGMFQPIIDFVGAGEAGGGAMLLEWIDDVILGAQQLVIWFEAEAARRLS
jgi:hypothetical protein